MKDENLTKKAFCTFCMALFEPKKIGAHLRRCSAHRDDADCIQLSGRRHPMAFLILGEVGDRPDGWVCLEAHGRAKFAELDRGLRRLWFPETKVPGFFLPGVRLRRRFGAEVQVKRRQRLESVLQVKDKFSWALPESTAGEEVRFEVVGLLPTAIMNCTVDVAAFPLGSQSGGSPMGAPGYKPSGKV